jgi:hypothetical protein
MKNEKPKKIIFRRRTDPYGMKNEKNGPDFSFSDFSLAAE